MAEVFATPPMEVIEAAGITVDPASSQRFQPNSAAQPILSVQNIEKVFGTKDSMTHALSGVSFELAHSEFASIMGPSGSGKTTLLNCVSTIDKPTTGRICVNGKDITGLSKRQLAKFRRDELGFIFQDSNLLNTLNGFENIALALTIKHDAPSSIPQRVNGVAFKLGVAECLKKYPTQMSSGQKQRIAAARAIVSEPSLVLADEPTGALDSRNATIMLETLEMMSQEMGVTILMVTHDAYAASFTDRTLFIKDGRLFNEIRRGMMPREEFFARIMEVISFMGGDVGHAA